MNRNGHAPALLCPECRKPLTVGVTASTMNGRKSTVECDQICPHCHTALTVTASVRWAAATASFAERQGVIDAWVRRKLAQGPDDGNAT